ncbi:lipopolysaccharide biosynthesis protein [Paenibacillus nitricinens]|uniref:lipopolysaccharide biosynthesis protein n=1 Tax=Paenibacillus nitricinens TaxID=3367691 RepID=UPI003F846B18
MSRTFNSLKNIKFALLGQASALLISFFARMVFVKTLSSDYLGLNGLFVNILSVLSFAELGVGTAIVYSLYKPLSERNQSQIKALMRLYKQSYITIGIIVAILGTALTPFLSYLIKDIPPIPNIQLIYLMFVINSTISYFFSYKRSLIIADQKRYIATFYQYLFYIILNIMQMIILLITRNYILFLGLQIFFTLFENLFISRKADILYPFIKGQTTERLDNETKKTIIRNIKAMLFHKFGGVVVNGTDSLLISKFLGVGLVGLYSNYLLIINALNTIFGMVFQSVTASIGNLGASESEVKSYNIFKCLNLIGFWIHGFAAICLAILFNPFIEIWLGNEFSFPISLVLIIIVSFYLTGMRKSVLTFRDALGLYWNDRYKPLFEASINLIASLILVNKIGIYGIFIGTIISTLTTCFWVEPYILYKYGFKKSISSYFLKYAIYTMIMLLGGGVTWLICYYIKGETISSFLLKGIICAIVPNTIFLLVFWKTAEFKYLISVVKTITRRKKPKLI